MSHHRLRLFVACGLVLAVIATFLGNQSNIYAKKPTQPPEEQPFIATTPEGSSLQILGHWVWIEEEDRWDPRYVEYAFGRPGRNNVVINRPTAIVQMDFLAEPEDSPFKSGDLYGGSIDIVWDQKDPRIRYFFRGPGIEEGTVLSYRLDGYASIYPEDFPNGESYTVTVSELELSVDTGKRNNGFTYKFDNDAEVYMEVIIYLGPDLPEPPNN